LLCFCSISTQLPVGKPKSGAGDSNKIPKPEPAPSAPAPEPEPMEASDEEPEEPYPVLDEEGVICTSDNGLGLLMKYIAFIFQLKMYFSFHQ